MTDNPISMTDLAIAIREGAQVESNHLYGKTAVFTLPSSGDEVALWPAPIKPQSPAPLRLLWVRRSQEGKTITGGELPWPSDPKPLVNWAISMAYSDDEIAPQYAPVLATLRDHNVIANLVHVQGVGHLLHVALPDSTYLSIGGEEGLPSRVDQVENWHVQHEGVDEHIGVVYHGPELHKMVSTTQLYLQATATRYGGHHPLGAPVADEREDGPDKLYGLLSDLSELRRVDHSSPGGAMMTIFDADGYNGATIAVPAEVVTRMSRLLSVEIRVIETYGG
ncbi:hypothetical protein OG478_13580 [Streptomyces phaeochromogenes]|uniref:hypothetical protein n=1 Tax=Streptomyces phaeochromogenes TaxID=1923 RepID=UPI0038643ECA|nr:hypothetical protein OG478_13580 [Streptomyces phaeochromogenes]